MSANFQLPKPFVFDTNGAQAAWTLRFFNAGTTTPKTVYSDAALGAPIAQPIATTSLGVFPRIFIGTGSYKVGLYTDAAGTIFASGYPVDDCDTGIPAGSGALPVANGGTGATTAAGARTNLLAASQTDLNTQAASLAAILAQIAALPGGAIVTTGTLTRAFLQAGFGSIPVQRSEVAASTTRSTVAGTIPADDTIPQITEGTQVLTGSFTPVSATSTLDIRIEIIVAAPAAATAIAIALFQDTTANAISATWTWGTGTDQTSRVVITHRMASPGTSPVTFSLRMGGTGGNTYFNGGSGRYGGGVAKSSIYITEFLAF